ncbi:MAG: glycosyltransferase, partial [Thermoanaerobaculia bacterium]
MRVAIDARALLNERTGIGTYTQAIARGLAARPDFTVGLFAPRPIPKSLGAAPGSVHTDHHPFGIVWLHSTLPQRIARWGADVLVSALTIGPARGRVPFVSTVHDLTPLTHPEWHTPRTLAGFVPLWERTVERAARFLCVSETTARDLAARYPETAPRIRVARNGVDRAFFFAADDPAARRRTRQRYAGGR